MNELAETLLWPAPPPAIALADGQVHAWAASLDVSLELIRAFALTLSDSERQRASRFKFKQLRNRFIAGRGLLRQILGYYVKSDPARLEFHYTPHGKPTITPESGIQFNLAHSEDLCLLAVTRLETVGVDLEYIRPIGDVSDLVSRFFSAPEAALFKSLEEIHRTSAFFRLWTKKEALLKADGRGITELLDRTNVSWSPAEPAQAITIFPPCKNGAKWALRELAPAPGFAAALACPARPFQVQTWAWNPGLTRNQ